MVYPHAAPHYRPTRRRALALAGAVMQGVSQIHWRTQVVMGVSAGASLGAVIAIALGVTSLGMFYMPAFAFVGAFVSVGITIILTLRNNKLDTTTFIARWCSCEHG